MPSSLISLPFWIPDGLGVTDGIAKVCETKLVLEFEVRGGLVGWIRLGVKEVAIPFDEIESVSLRTGVFKSTLIITTKSLSPASDVPGGRRGQISLCVAREDKKKAKEVESLLAFGLARRELHGLRSRLGQRHLDASTPEDAF